MINQEAGQRAIWGHETFAIREGWLHKGLRLLDENAEIFTQDDVADHLGVGRNMGKRSVTGCLPRSLRNLPQSPSAASEPCCK